MVAVEVKTIDSLKDYRQWVCALKPGKEPINPHTGGNAMPNNTATWASYEQAYGRWQRESERLLGIGYVLAKEQGITCTDLDHCIDEQGHIAAYARDIIKRLNSYTEVSPSGTGLHIWTLGKIPSNISADPTGRNKVEMYDHGHYMTITGNHLEDTPAMIELRQAELLLLHMEVSEARAQAAAEAKAEKRKAKGQQGQTSPDVQARNGDTPYGLTALQEECSDLASTPEGGRWERMRSSGFKIGQLVGGGELTRDTAESQLRRAAEECGLTDDEIKKTLYSSIDAGKEEPRAAPPKEAAGMNGHAPASASHTRLPDYRGIIECFHDAEYGDARLFASMFRGKAVFDVTSKEWYIFNGQYWELDELGQIRHFVSGELASMYIRAAAEANLRAGTITADNADAMKELKELIKGLTGRAFALKKLSVSNNVLTMATSFKGMAITSTQWDRDPMILPVQNGIVDLKTGQLRDGTPEDYVRTVAPTEWNGLDEPAPIWTKTLEEIFDDRDAEERSTLIAFIQRMLGYGVTGLTIERIFVMFYGEYGNNGKDTIMKAIKSAMGKLAGTVSRDVFLASGKGHTAGSATPHLCDLQGKRLAWASEPEKGQRFSVGQVKDLSGDAPISTRQNYGKQYEFDPTHLLLLLTNHKPHAPADDTSFWGRLRLVTFNWSYVDEPTQPHERKKNPTLRFDLEKEKAGILAWLVRGCLEWQENGLQTPDQVKKDVEEYRKKEDNLLDFIEACCIVGDKYTSRAGKMYTIYSSWCETNNIYTLDSKNFGLEMAKKYPKLRDVQGLYYKGIGVLDDDPTLHDPTYQSRKRTDQPVEPSHNGNQSSSSNGACRVPTSTLHSNVEQPVERFQGTKQANVVCRNVESNPKVYYTIRNNLSEKKLLDSPYIPTSEAASYDNMKQPVERTHDGMYSASETLHDPTLTLHDPTWRKSEEPPIEEQFAALTKHWKEKKVSRVEWTYALYEASGQRYLPCTLPSNIFLFQLKEVAKMEGRSLTAVQLYIREALQETV